MVVAAFDASEYPEWKCIELKPGDQVKLAAGNDKADDGWVYGEVKDKGHGWFPERCVGRLMEPIVEKEPGEERPTSEWTLAQSTSSAARALWSSCPRAPLALRDVVPEVVPRCATPGCPLEINGRLGGFCCKRCHARHPHHGRLCTAKHAAHGAPTASPVPPPQPMPLWGSGAHMAYGPPAVVLPSYAAPLCLPMPGPSPLDWRVPVSTMPSPPALQDAEEKAQVPQFSRYRLTRDIVDTSGLRLESREGDAVFLLEPSAQGEEDWVLGVKIGWFQRRDLQRWDEAATGP